MSDKEYWLERLKQEEHAAETAADADAAAAHLAFANLLRSRLSELERPEATVRPSAKPLPSLDKLPDPAYREEYEVLRANVSDWIASRDRRLIFNALVSLCRSAQSAYVSVMLDEGATNTHWRRYGRSLHECDRLASAFAGCMSATTVHMVIDFPRMRKPLLVLDAGRSYFAHSTMPTPDQSVGLSVSFAEGVMRSFGFAVTLEAHDTAGNSLVGVVSQAELTDERVFSYLLYLPAMPSKDEGAASIVAQMFGLDQEGAWRRAMLLLNDIRGERPGVQFMTLDETTYEAVRSWSGEAFQEEAHSGGEYPRSGRRGLEAIPEPPPAPGQVGSTVRSGTGSSALYHFNNLLLPFRGDVVIGYFDLLGFSGFVDERWNYPIRPEEFLKQLRVDLTDSGSETWGGVHLPEIRTISDSIIAFIPVQLGTTKVGSAFEVMAKLSRKLQFLCARLGFGLRGAIELGELFCDSEDVTGPALARAVKLEAGAKTMRTIIGPNLLEALGSQLAFEFHSRNEDRGRPEGVLFRYDIRRSPDGLLRVSYRQGILATIEQLQKDAPSEYTKAKYNEFINAFAEGKLDPVGSDETLSTAEEFADAAAICRRMIS